jgi:dienelactone hydrolase
MPETRLIETAVHGRYIIREGGPRLLIGFHGYAENAEIHMAQLEKIPGSKGWTLVAIQALHPFYTRNDQMVVANWMTRMDREHAIADNLAYISKVVSDVGASTPLVFLGFSQGAAMAYRAASHIPCDAVIALGGDLPPDVAAQVPVQLPRHALIARGQKDDWFNEEKLKKDLNFLRPVSQVQTITFDGGHEWTDEFRAAVGKFLEAV